MARRDPQREQFWRRTLQDWKHSGQSINTFCRDRRLNLSNFFRWRKRFAEDHGPPPSPAFVPVRVVAEAMAEVVLTNGVVVRLPLAADPDAVTPFLAAVRAAVC